jgi:cytochrome b
MLERETTVRVWDLPIRLFHWGIVVGVFTSWLTQYENWMQAHEICGYSIFAALLFRLSWGLIGSDTARFRNFLRSPLAGIEHLRHFRRCEPDREVGHNAAGGWMVLVILLLLAIQVGSGLCANNQVDFQGPLADRVGQDWSDFLSSVHAANFTAIEVAVLLHVAAVLAYALVKGQNLVRPMVTGVKRLPAGTRAPRLASSALALLLVAISGGIVAFVVTWFQ